MTEEQKQRLVEDLFAILHAGASDNASPAMAEVAVEGARTLIEIEKGAWLREELKHMETRRT